MRLLAYLALHPGSHSREKLVEVFWPDLELDAARNSLSSTLLYLKKPLERDLGVPEGTLIVATRTTIGLVPGSYTTDLENLPKDFDTERLLPGFYDDWVLEAREKLGAMLAATPNDYEPLPATWTPYLGRDDTREQVRELLNNSRLLTLVGTGGVGKTRLALETLRLREAEGGPVAWVELSTLTDPAQIPERIAAALGLAGTAALVPVLRRRAILLCLDNCEHLILGAACEAERLLRACPNLTILATSREPLGIAGETLLRLPGLSEAEAAQLFCDRARRAQPGWELTHAERPFLSLLCLRLDGLPLAIELAAAKLRTYPLTELVQRLEDRLATLTSNHRVAEPRQQTLEASIAWSYELLSEAEKVLFYSLSVFHGGWTAEQAIALWGGDEALRERLDTLVDKSLAQIEATSHSLRYRFLETIREFAQARFAELPEAEQLRWRRAHLGIFYDLLLTVPRRYYSANVRCEEIRPEQDNFLPALEFCRQDQPERALVFCWHLSTFWDWFAQSALAREQLKLTLPLPECQTLDDDRRIALDELHYASIYTRDWDTAEWALNASDVATEHPYHYRQALADLYIYQEELDKARPLFEENLRESREMGALDWVADALFRLHSPYLLMGDFARALSLVEEGESMADASSESFSPNRRRALLRVKSLIKGLQGELDEARRLMEPLKTPKQSHHEIAYYLVLCAHLEFFAGNVESATRQYGTSIAWCQHKGFDLRGYTYSTREKNLAQLREHLRDEAFQALYDEGYNRDFRDVLQMLGIS